MAGTSLLFGLVFLMLGIALWIAATQNAAKLQNVAQTGESQSERVGPGRRFRATRRGAVISIVAGLVLFVSRTESLWVLVAVTVVALAAMAAG